MYCNWARARDSPIMPAWGCDCSESRSSQMPQRGAISDTNGSVVAASRVSGGPCSGRFGGKRSFWGSLQARLTKGGMAVCMYTPVPQPSDWLRFLADGQHGEEMATTSNSCKIGGRRAAEIDDCCVHGNPAVLPDIFGHCRGRAGSSRRGGP